MNREVCKFFSGSFAALAYAHAAYAVATSRGIIDEPVFLGRRWGAGYMWTEAAVYSAASLALGCIAWKSKPQARQEESATSGTDAQGRHTVGAADQTQLVTG